jgi:hypothetical protein
MVSAYYLTFVLDGACDYCSTILVPNPLVLFELMWISPWL